MSYSFISWSQIIEIIYKQQSTLIKGPDPSLSVMFDSSREL